MLLAEVTMRKLEEWFELYGESHQDPINVTIHKIVVPVITFCIYCILWNIKIPISDTGEFNLLVPFLIGALIFYKRLGEKPFMIMTGVSFLLVATISVLEGFLPLFSISIALFIVAWILQFYGHRIEGKKPSFFTDLTFLLIGPLWIIMRKFK